MQYDKRSLLTADAKSVHTLFERSMKSSDAMYITEKSSCQMHKVGRLHVSSVKLLQSML